MPQSVSEFNVDNSVNIAGCRCREVISSCASSLLSLTFLVSLPFFFQGTSYDSHYVSNTTSTALFMCASSTEQLFTPVPPTDRLHEWRCEKAASKWHVVVSRKIARSCLFLWKSAEDDFSCCQPENFELKLHLMDVALKHRLIPFSFLLLVNWLVWLV